MSSQPPLVPVRGSSLPPISEINTLTDLVVIQRLLQDAVQHEDAIKQELDRILTKSEHLDAKLDYLEVVPTKLKPILKECQELDAQIHKTCSLADDVSRRVRELDSVRDRLGRTVRKVEDVLDVKNCVDGVNKALASDDLETAGTYVERYLLIGSESARLLDTAQLSALSSARDRFEQLVNTRLAAATAAADVLRCCKLFVALGRRHEGRARYVQQLSRNLASLILAALAAAPPPLSAAAAPLALPSGFVVTPPAASSSPAVSSSTPPSGASAAPSGAASAAASASSAARIASYPQYLRAILETFVKSFERNQADVEKSFGVGSARYLLVELAAVVELIAVRIVNTFIEKQGVGKLSTDVASHKRNRRSSPPDVDVRQLADYLEIICLFAATAHGHRNYCTQQLATLPQEKQQKQQTTSASSSSSSSTSPSTSTSSSPPSLSLSSELPRHIQLLLAQYLELEEFYMVQSIQKAIDMDAADRSKASSLVDNVFFVLHRACQRAAASCSANTLCAVVTIINNCLNMDLTQFLQNQLRERASQYTSSFSTALSAASSGSSSSSSASSSAASASSSAAGTNYMGTLNHLEASGEYVLKLRTELEAQVERTFASADERDREKIRTLLADLHETARAFKRLLQSNLEQVGATVAPLLRKLVEVFQEVSYELNEEEFAALEAGTAGDAGSWLEKFCSQLELILAPFRENLSASNFEQLLRLMVSDITTRLEKALLAKRFTQLGGLQFDKDLRKLIAHFSASSQLSVRSEFARLSQLAILLNLEKVTEVYEYYNSGHMTWRLTPAEVRKMLSRRIDFTPAQIAAIKL